MDLQKELETAKEAALEAGKKILEIYNSDAGDIHNKSEGSYESPVTKADVEANNIITKKLRSSFPEHAILTEEEQDNKERLNNEFVWIIDPLDGTKEFISKNGEFTVNIALTRQGSPILGVIFIPAKGELFYAVEGQGAFYEKEGKTVKMKVSNRDKIEDMSLMVSRSHMTEKEAKLIQRYDFKEVKKSGSSLKGCRVAKGDADLYFRLGRTHEWDICAMHAIINEAGGVMTDLEGNQITYNNDELFIHGFIVSNNKIHGKLLSIVKEIDR